MPGRRTPDFPGCGDYDLGAADFEALVAGTRTISVGSSKPIFPTNRSDRLSPYGPQSPYSRQRSHPRGIEIAATGVCDRARDTVREPPVPARGREAGFPRRGLPPALHAHRRHLARPSWICPDQRGGRRRRGPDGPVAARAGLNPVCLLILDLDTPGASSVFPQLAPVASGRLGLAVRHRRRVKRAARS